MHTRRLNSKFCSIILVSKLSSVVNRSFVILFQILRVRLQFSLTISQVLSFILSISTQGDNSAKPREKTYIKRHKSIEIPYKGLV